MNDRPVILIVGSNRSNLNLLSQQLSREGFETIKAASPDDLDNALKKQNNIALSLVDVSGFDQNIWLFCEQMRRLKIPFIVISPQRSLVIQRDSMKHGASALLIKPLGIKELLEFVHTLLGD
ncbi:MAG: response regulator transcription factor [Dehalococcoidales bacterium]|nr:response regulator transcription factor [Dehalococcoidales bacterium]